MPPGHPLAPQAVPEEREQEAAAAAAAAQPPAQAATGGPFAASSAVGAGVVAVAMDEEGPGSRCAACCCAACCSLPAGLLRALHAPPAAPVCRLRADSCSSLPLVLPLLPLPQRRWRRRRRACGRRGRRRRPTWSAAASCGVTLLPSPRRLQPAPSASISLRPDAQLSQAGKALPTSQPVRASALWPSSRTLSALVSPGALPCQRPNPPCESPCV